MTRAENPILLWLLARVEHLQASRERAEPPDPWGVALWTGKAQELRKVLLVCRWLDAEDAWSDDPHDREAWWNWAEWRRARMAEAGVL